MQVSNKILLNKFSKCGDIYYIGLIDFVFSFSPRYILNPPRTRDSKKKKNGELSRWHNYGGGGGAYIFHER